MTGNFLFKNISCEFNLEQKLVYKTFFPLIFSEENFKFKSITFIFCDDEYLKNLNTEFLGHDNYTDILTFCLSDKTKPIIAEIYISIDRVLYNSSIFEDSFEDELNRVMIHGILHLCGYEDYSRLLKVKMREREDYYLQKFNK